MEREIERLSNQRQNQACSGSMDEISNKNKELHEKLAKVTDQHRATKKTLQEAEKAKVSLAKNVGELQTEINRLNGELAKAETEAARSARISEQISEIRASVTNNSQQQNNRINEANNSSGGCQNSQTGANNSTRDKQNRNREVNNSPRKTWEKCRYFEMGNCREGSNCRFFHPEIECRYVKYGKPCPKGVKCWDLHKTQPQNHRDCEFWLQGYCKYGEGDCRKGRHDQRKFGTKIEKV